MGLERLPQPAALQASWLAVICRANTSPGSQGWEPLFQSEQDFEDCSCPVQQTWDQGQGS